MPKQHEESFNVSNILDSLFPKDDAIEKPEKSPKRDSISRRKFLIGAGIIGGAAITAGVVEIAGYGEKVRELIVSIFYQIKPHVDSGDITPIQAQALFEQKVTTTAAKEGIPSTALPSPLPTMTWTATPSPTETITPTPMDKAINEAVNIYGIPLDQAMKLEGLNVMFEVITRNVDGVLVKDAQTGEDSFYYDLQTEFLVAVDRWSVITDPRNYADVIFSKQEVLTKEFYAWTKYLVSNVGEGIGPNGYARSDGKMIKAGDSAVGYTYLVDFPGLMNKGVTYAKLSEEDLYYLLMVNSYRFNEKEYPVILIIRKSIYANQDNAEKVMQIFINMKRSPILVNSITVTGEEDPFIQKIIHSFGEQEIEEAMETFEGADPSLVSQPGMIFLSFIAESPMFEK